jgi:lipopolysaccharide export LptBFGC system permease protein LptF
MMGARRGTRRAATAITLLVGGVALALATWIGGSATWAIAIAGVYVVLAAGAWAWAGGSGDTAAILRWSGDERQRGLDRDATAMTAVVMAIAALCGAFASIARTGDPGAYGVMCLVGGVAYIVGLGALRVRR